MTNQHSGAKTRLSTPYENLRTSDDGHFMASCPRFYSLSLRKIYLSRRYFRPKAVHQIGAMVYKEYSEQAAVDFHFFCNIFVPSR